MFILVDRANEGFSVVGTFATQAEACSEAEAMLKEADCQLEISEYKGAKVALQTRTEVVLGDAPSSNGPRRGRPAGVAALRNELGQCVDKNGKVYFPGRKGKAVANGHVNGFTMTSEGSESAAVAPTEGN